MLRKRADEKGLALDFVEVCSDLPANAPQPQPECQLLNFSLARVVTASFLQQRALSGDGILSLDDIIEGIQAFTWPGRFQSMSDGKLLWFLDGAHNEFSLRKCAQWFAQMTASNTSVCRILIFGHYSNHRDHVALLKSLVCSLYEHHILIQHVIFTNHSHTQCANIGS